MPTGSELVTQAKGNFSSFATTVSDVQSLIWTDDWEVPGRGDLVLSCNDDSYYFTYERRLPVDGFGEWRLEGGPEGTAQQIATWLREHDFTVTESENTAGIAFTAVTAQKESAGIKNLYVQLFPGEATDTVTLSAESTCFPGSAMEFLEDFRSGSWDMINQPKPLPQSTKDSGND